MLKQVLSLIFAVSFAPSCTQLKSHSPSAVKDSTYQGSPQKAVLMVLTSYDGQGTPHPTGYWGEEFSVPFDLFTKAGYSVTVASPLGGIPPVDAASVDDTSRSALNATFSDLKTRNMLKRLSEIKAEKFDAVFVVGGHGVIWDLVVDPDLNRLLLQFDQQKKVVSAVCHGPAAFVNVKDSTGTSILSNHIVTGFSLAEEKAVNLIDYVNSSKLQGQLQERLQKLAQYKNAEPWQPYSVTSGNIVTGQNPQSSKVTAEAVLKVLGR